MLYELARGLTAEWSALNVVNYLTFRAIMATITAFVIALWIGQPLIRALARYKIGQQIRREGPQSHQGKAGTPTMGGTLILAALLAGVVLWGDWSVRQLWVAVLVTLAFGLVGGLDDWLKLKRGNSKGLSAGQKYLGQTIAGFAAALYLYFSAVVPAETALLVPFFKDVALPLGFLFVLLTYFVIVGTSNAVNLTDGLDGLAIVPTVLVAGALGIFAYVIGNAAHAGYLGFPYVPGTGELLVFCGALVGAGLGFLWFNAYPASVFMGDIGALALGAALGVVAVMARQEIVLVVMGGVFVMETLSVMLQVASFKLTGKRIFRMAPLHHHFELKGWPEPKVIVRLWIVTVVLVLVGLSTLKLR